MFQFSKSFGNEARLISHFVVVLSCLILRELDMHEQNLKFRIEKKIQIQNDRYF